VAIEDQDRAALSDLALGSGVTDWTGTVSASNLDFVNTSSTVLGTMTDPSGLYAPTQGLFTWPLPGPFMNPPVLDVISTEFLQHLAATVHVTPAALLNAGVALVHIVASDGVTPVGGAQLYAEFNYPGLPLTQSLSALQGGLTYQGETPVASNPPFPWYFYIGANGNGVEAYSPSSGVATSSAGLIVIVGPAPLTYTAGDQVFDQAYTAGTSGQNPVVVFGGKPGTVIDVFLKQD
jgi:hypothetical protein